MRDRRWVTVPSGAGQKSQATRERTVEEGRKAQSHPASAPIGILCVAACAEPEQGYKAAGRRMEEASYARWEGLGASTLR